MDSISQRFGVVQVGFYGSHHNPGVNGDQVKADQLESYPGINHDALIQNSVQHIEKAGAAGLVLDNHGDALKTHPEGLPVPELAAVGETYDGHSPKLAWVYFLPDGGARLYS